MQSHEKIDLKVGFLCNNKCRFCVQGNKREDYGNLELSNLVTKLEEGRKESSNIVLTGGEATIRKDIDQLVKTAKTLDFSLIQLQTNGRMLSSLSFCERMIRAGVTEFSIALHGNKAELHDYLTRAKGSFYQTVKGIINIKKLGQFVSTNTVITRSNYRNLPDIARLLVHLHVDQFQLAFVHPVGTAGENFNSIVPRFCLIEPYVKEGLSVGINVKKKVMTEAIPYCFMNDFYKYVAEKIIPDTKIYDLNVIENYTEYRRTEGKAKGDNCINCNYNSICEGPWREYPEKYGWEEFNPILN